MPKSAVKSGAGIWLWFRRLSCLFQSQYKQRQMAMAPLISRFARNKFCLKSIFYPFIYLCTYLSYRKTSLLCSRGRVHYISPGLINRLWFSLLFSEQPNKTCIVPVRDQKTSCLTNKNFIIRLTLTPWPIKISLLGSVLIRSKFENYQTKKGLFHIITDMQLIHLYFVENNW